MVEKKFVKLKDHTYACNNFEYERRAKTGNGNQVNLLKLVLRKTREITSGELIFGGF